MSWVCKKDTRAMNRVGPSGKAVGNIRKGDVISGKLRQSNSIWLISGNQLIKIRDPITGEVFMEKRSACTEEDEKKQVVLMLQCLVSDCGTSTILPTSEYYQMQCSVQGLVHAHVICLSSHMAEMLESKSCPCLGCDGTILHVNKIIGREKTHVPFTKNGINTSPLNMPKIPQSDVVNKELQGRLTELKKKKAMENDGDDDDKNVGCKVMAPQVAKISKSKNLLPLHYDGDSQRKQWYDPLMESKKQKEEMKAGLESIKKDAEKMIKTAGSAEHRVRSPTAGILAQVYIWLECKSSSPFSFVRPRITPDHIYQYLNQETFGFSQVK